MVFVLWLRVSTLPPGGSRGSQCSWDVVGSAAEQS